MVTANDTNRLFGASNPVFSATYAGFVAGEGPLVLGGSPAFSTTADPSSLASGSPYPIGVGSGTLVATNYSLSFIPGHLTIIPGPGQPQKVFSLVKLPDGSAAVLCGGAAGQTYLLLAASSLSSGSWTPIATNATDINGLMTCVDKAAASFQSRFYRTSLP